MWHVFGIGVKVDRGVGDWMCPLFFCHDNTCDWSVSRPSRFTIGKRSHSIFLESLVEVTLVCETADTHRLPHVLGTFATARLAHMICTGVSICPTLVALPCMAAQSWCFHSDTWGTVTVLHLQLVLCTEPDRFVADCWCAFVRFSSVPGTSQASPLFTCL